MLTPRMAASFLLVGMSVGVSGCFGNTGGCVVTGAFLDAADGRSARVNVSGLDAHLSLSFENASFLLSIEVGGGNSTAYHLTFAPLSPDSGAILLNTQSFRPFQMDPLELRTTYTFGFRLIVTSDDPAVSAWIFFGADNIVTGWVQVAQDRRDIHAGSADFAIPPSGGRFVAAEQLDFDLQPIRLCS